MHVLYITKRVSWKWLWASTHLTLRNEILTMPARRKRVIPLAPGLISHSLKAQRVEWQARRASLISHSFPMCRGFTPPTHGRPHSSWRPPWADRETMSPIYLSTNSINSGWFLLFVLHESLTFTKLLHMTKSVSVMWLWDMWWSNVTSNGNVYLQKKKKNCPSLRAPGIQTYLILQDETNSILFNTKCKMSERY